MPLISLRDYAGVWFEHPDFTPEVQDRAADLIKRANTLLDEISRQAVSARTNPKTGTIIAGETYGGFRPKSCPIGAPGSAHKTGEAIDIFDPFGALGSYLQMRKQLLVNHGLWMENPYMTPTWVHWQTRAVKSGNTIFNP